ncbi:hypothetical protein Desor_3658 [Desulfosporosinus orientis DSM 765]|uniref:Acetyltransferase (GNAT) family protein n=1 Tax=Desulfosporosinus orientis (strain ATCC 19365 / DSM 765 / NCIMB 8382 / VKM B-1628 / Singapore I) TaxID=768706 RepID=G7WIR2_DESOD|nr:GNAT family N-acetyltransferase [Desulfosporosinus orientis]AET69136.1 hypothetical protein Desor_3658 [Desulfosporosinus orientis DSM 765]
MIGDHGDLHPDLSNPRIRNNPRDTGIFVYVPLAPTVSEPHQALSPKDLQIRVMALRNRLNKKYNLHFEIVNDETGIVCIEDSSEIEFTQFLFHFCNYHQGIYLDWLSFPSHQLRKGIGSFCVNWLQDFAGDFGIKFIVLGSVAEARGFWIKMGFRLLQSEELDNFPGYQGRYRH